MRRLPATLLGAALLATPATAAMSVAEFLGKVDALYAKGPLALFSPDIGALKREGIAAAEAWRAQARAPNACPGDPAKVDIGQTDFLRMIRAVPPAARASTSIAQAIIPPLNARYPCR